VDRSLQSLLTSSGAVSTEAEGSLAEIARAILVDKPGEDKRSVREKAGLLALLNLLGIVDAFYSESPESDQEASDAIPSSSSSSSPSLAQSSAPSPSEGPPSLLPALTRLISAASQPDAGPGSQSTHAGVPAPAGGPLSSLLGSLDPALLAGMLGLVSSIARARMPRQPDSGEGAHGDSAVPSGSEGVQEASVRELPPGQPDSAGTSAESPGGSPVAPKAAGPTPASQPSPLQQVLGIDPRVLTLALNLLAELMKSRTLEQKPSEQARQKEPCAGETSVPKTHEASVGTAATRKAPLGPRLYHKPGFGIYRSPNPAHRAKTHPDSPRED